MCGVELSRFSVFFIVITFLLQTICSTSDLPEKCVPSSCGKIPDISHPFRLKGDPEHCGDPKYELACEDNITVLSLFSGKYHVQSINYNNYTVRIVDPGLKEDDCSSFPRYFLSWSNFSETHNYPQQRTLDGFREPYRAIPDWWSFATLFEHVVYLNCSNRVSDDPEYVDTAPCLNWPSKGHIYAIPFDLSVGKLKVGCHVKFAATMAWNWSLDTDNKTLSYSDIHRMLLYGFEVSWLHRICQDLCPPTETCFFNSSSKNVECYGFYCGIFGITAICSGLCSRVAFGNN